MNAAQHIVQLGPIAVELIDRTMIELARENPVFRPTIEKFVRETPEAILLVEFGEENHEENLRRLRRLKQLVGDLGFDWENTGAKWGGVVEVFGADLQAAIAEVRTAGLNIMMSMKEEGKPVSFVEDCAVPLDHLADYTSRLTQIFDKHGTRGTWYAHAGAGCLHVRPVLNLRQEKDVHAMREIAEEAFAMVREYKGSHSGEHGDGLVRSEFNEAMFGSRLARAFEEVKDRFDPNGLYNPGKVVRPPKFDDRSLFRYAPGYHGEDIKTHLDWSAYSGAGGGFQGAVEMCNNNGACRKLAGGAMCPSYRVTRDERDVTRGRANTLRLAITGQLGPDALASDEMAETLTLCVSCKACRRECPTGVDMARMKIEVQAARAAKHGVSLHDRLVGWLPRYAPYAARWPWLFNLRDDSPLLRRASELIAGFSARRSLPKWRRDIYRDRSDWGYPAVANEPGREVVLFADTFNRYFERENLDAAVSVLTAGGYRVHAALPQDGERRPLCCGRTFLVESARSIRRGAKWSARWMRWRPFAARGVPVIGLEPSCLLTFRDELPALIKGEAAEALAANALLLEEFLAREHKDGRLNLPLGPVPKKALLHGHCHQKAFDAMGAVESVLRLIPELAVETVESSCCGMAGSFGYAAADHRRLAQDGRIVAAAGGAQGARRRADRRRRHLVPASDSRRQRAGRHPRRPRAGDEHWRRPGTNGVMAGLVLASEFTRLAAIVLRNSAAELPAIHALFDAKTWMPGMKPGMTAGKTTNAAAKLLPTSLVGSYAQPDWLIDRKKLAGRFPPRVRAKELWRVAPEFLDQAQDDATLIAIRDQERAGLDIVTDGEMRRESYSNRFATALEGVDIDNPGTALDRSGHPNPVPRVTGKVRRKHPVEVRDVQFLRANTDRTIKITVPGPFTMSQQAQNDFYKDEQEMVLDYAAAVNAEIKDLFAAGADIVQIDEPYMQARPDKARKIGLERAQGRARRRQRHDGDPYLLRLRRHHPCAAGRLFVPARACRLHPCSRCRSRPRNPSSTARCWKNCRARPSFSACSICPTWQSRRRRRSPRASAARCRMCRRSASWSRPIAG